MYSVLCFACFGEGPMGEALALRSLSWKSLKLSTERCAETARDRFEESEGRLCDLEVAKMMRIYVSRSMEVKRLCFHQ